MKAIQKNKHVWISVAVGLVIAGGAVAGNVTLPNTFQPSTPARASEMNANFTAVTTAVNDNFSLIGALQSALTTLTARVTSTENSITALNPRVSAAENSLASVDSRLDAVEQQQLAAVPLVAIQSGSAVQGTAGVWTAIPGASLTFTTTKASTPVLLTAAGSMHAAEATTWLRCAVRFTVDGAPLAGADPKFGNALMSPGPSEAGAAAFLPFAAIEKYTLGPGPHTIALELTKGAVGVTTPPAGQCALWLWHFSRAKLVVQQL